MKSFLHELIKQSTSPLEAKNQTREYLQARILACLQKSGAFLSLAFHGGTALRFLYGFGRYSEDLDFSLEGNKMTSFDFKLHLKQIQSTFEDETYQVRIKLNESKIVNSAFVRFPGLLYELGLSPINSETLAIKIEVDTNPPKAAELETSIVRRFLILHLYHHNKATLLAGKLHALLQRPYTKGRDLYDLLWYLSDRTWPKPNLQFLNNALEQSQWQGEVLTEQNWRSVMLKKLQTISWDDARNDVSPFVMPGFNVALLNIDTFASFLK